MRCRIPHNSLPVPVGLVRRAADSTTHNPEFHPRRGRYHPSLARLPGRSPPSIECSDPSSSQLPFNRAGSRKFTLMIVAREAGVISACALQCMGGTMQGRLHPRSQEERDQAVALGYQVDKVGYGM